MYAFSLFVAVVFAVFVTIWWWLCLWFYCFGIKFPFYSRLLHSRTALCRMSTAPHPLTMKSISRSKVALGLTKVIGPHKKSSEMRWFICHRILIHQSLRSATLGGTEERQWWTLSIRHRKFQFFGIWRQTSWCSVQAIKWHSTLGEDWNRFGPLNVVV